MKSTIMKRLTAYIIDIMLITIITSLISMAIPTSNEVKELNKERNNLYQKYVDKKINENDYLKKSNNINYEISYQTMYITIVTDIIIILYFIIYQYKNNGQTIGKKTMKIRVKKDNDGELSINDFIIRSLIVNSLFVSIFSMIMMFILSKGNYIVFDSVIYILQGLVIMGIFLMILIRKDKRGIHDIITGTKVVVEE